MANYELKAVITADDNASSTISKVGGAFTSLAKIGIAGAVAGVGALTYALKKSVDEFAEGQKGIAQTNAVLKSTKGISGETAESIDRMNKALSHSTMFNDDMVRTGQNMLLTFTNIGKDVFPMATETVLDMAQALGQDTASSAMQLGKALNDPIKGVTALRRVGVQLTDAQADMVEKMVKAGDVMGAQKVILQELQTEFGGSAKAAGQTFAGSIAILNQSLDDMKESIGSAVVTAIQPFISKLATWASNPDVQDKIVAISTLITQSFIVAIQWLVNSIQILVNWFINAKNAIVEFFTQNQNGILIMETFRALVAVLWEQLKNLWAVIVENKNVFMALGQTILFLIGVALAAFIAALITVTWIVGSVIQVVGMLNNAFRSLSNTFSTMWNSGLVNFRNMVNTIIRGVNSVIRARNAVFPGADIGMVPSFQTGGIMKADGLAYLHKGEKVIPTTSVTNNDQGVTVNFYGNIANTSGGSLDDIANRIGRQIQLAQQSAI